MGIHQTAKGKLVEDFCKKYEGMPSLTLAKLIYDKHKLEFKSVEATRQLIRSYRGNSGEQNRVNRVDKSLFRQNGKAGQINTAHFPADYTTDFKHFTLSKAENNILVIGDLHIPNHRSAAFNAAFEYGLKNKVNTIILNGDVLDNTPFTRHGGKRPTSAQVRDWFDLTELFFEHLQITFPKAKIYWLEGNHDFWYRRWMLEHAHQLDEDPYYSLQARLHVEEYGITFIPQEHYVMAGKLTICHGHQLAGRFGMGVAPARAIFNKTKKSVMISHVHVADTYTDTNIHGEMYTCYTTGCNCTLTPEYQPFGGKGCHGFAHVKVLDNGTYHVNNFRVKDGQIM
jgi:predicted phosphodiesterase